MEYTLNSVFIICGIILALVCGCHNSRSLRVTQTELCAKLTAIDCANGYVPEANETVCCSDNKVYPNLCFFAKEKCEKPSLTILYPGECKHSTVTPTNATHTTWHTDASTTTPSPTSADIIHEVFCSHQDRFNCSDELDPVCGTDFIFYQNDCLFAKAQCESPDLRVQVLDACKTHRRLRRWLRSM